MQWAVGQDFTCMAHLFQTVFIGYMVKGVYLRKNLILRVCEFLLRRMHDNKAVSYDEAVRLCMENCIRILIFYRKICTTEVLSLMCWCNISRQVPMCLLWQSVLLQILLWTKYHR